MTGDDPGANHRMTQYLLLSAAIFAIGAYGVLARRNLLIVLMSLELMLNGVNIALVAFARNFGDTQPDPDGQVFVLMVMAVAAAEVAVGLAIVISLFRTRQTVDTNDLQSMNG
jgi:NADH-quinone oxidoreductase subunit K